ncbi:hypothetical protein RB599_010078 [Gaeumannomyces hyphopodioides]
MSAPVNGLSPAGRRLYWTLQGPLASSAISVMPENLNPDAPHEPCYRGQAPADDGTATAWHPISQEPITEQPVASLTVMECNLDYWRDGWYDINIEPNDDLYELVDDKFVATGDEKMLVWADPPGSVNADVEDKWREGMRWNFEQQQQRQQEQRQQQQQRQ